MSLLHALVVEKGDPPKGARRFSALRMTCSLVSRFNYILIFLFHFLKPQLSWLVSLINKQSFIFLNL